ncbi:hypothetical protein KUCAC02_023678, partial [Chaenocephalus aceratus]
LRPCIISTSAPWGLTDPPPSCILHPSISVRSHAIVAHSCPGRWLTFSLVFRDTARGADEPSPASPQRGDCAK